ncbi:hypothetical protein ACSBR2_041829 [Camellia fascicularis]
MKHLKAESALSGDRSLKATVSGSALSSDRSSMKATASDNTKNDGDGKFGFYLFTDLVFFQITSVKKLIIFQELLFFF